MAAKHVEEIWNTRFAAIKNTRHYATSTWSKRKRDLHGQPMPDHRKRKKLRQLI
jgi:ribosomal protein L35